VNGVLGSFNQGMKAQRSFTGHSGMTRLELVVVICALGTVVRGFFYAAMVWKRGSDRSATILNIRNCQQAMRGHQGMKQLDEGDPFTVRDLERYMKFPPNIRVLEGEIAFDPGAEKVTRSPYPGPAVNSDHLWLKVDAPRTRDYIGRYGFKDISEFADW